LRTREVQETEAVNVLLVFWRDSDPMDGTVDMASSKQAESVTGVDGDGCVLGFDPLPFVS
jgi:hypothetical protein